MRNSTMNRFGADSSSTICFAFSRYFRRASKSIFSAGWSLWSGLIRLIALSQNRLIPTSLWNSDFKRRTTCCCIKRESARESSVFCSKTNGFRVSSKPVKDSVNPLCGVAVRNILCSKCGMTWRIILNRSVSSPRCFGAMLCASSTINISHEARADDDCEKDRDALSNDSRISRWRR